MGNNKKYEYEKRMSYVDCVGWEVVCYQFFVLFDCISNITMHPKVVEGGKDRVLYMHYCVSQYCYLLLASQLLCRYALGGYDGSTMVRSTEIYDPRLATWMVGEPMELARGYSAAAVLQDSIYVIGGVKSNEEIVDVVRITSF